MNKRGADRHNQMTNLRGFKGSSYGPAGPVKRIDPATVKVDIPQPAKKLKQPRREN